MKWKQKAKALKARFERLARVHITRRLPQGVDLFADMLAFLPKCHIETIFDVGANVGQSCIEYLGRFPQANIYCFEPVTRTFDDLCTEVSNHDRVSCHRLALGEGIGEGKMVKNGHDSSLFFLDWSDEVAPDDETSTEEVGITCLDSFCGENGIERISFLKIDTEGGDLRVLKGGSKLLSERRIDLIQVEAGMNSYNTLHVPFGDIVEFLVSYEYALFGVYEQVRERRSGKPYLRRSNPVFISPRAVEANQIPE